MSKTSLLPHLAIVNCLPAKRVFEQGRALGQPPALLESIVADDPVAVVAGLEQIVRLLVHLEVLMIVTSLIFGWVPDAARGATDERAS